MRWSTTTSASRWQAGRRRARQLAGDARAGSSARGKARRAQRRYLRANRAWLAVGVTALLGVLLAAVAVIPSSFGRGLLLGAGLTGAAGAVAFWTVQVTGTGPAMMGDLAEQWTASELRPLRRDGWRMVNHLLLKTYDIDHLLVGPGGVWAVETKWSSKPWQLHPPQPRVHAAAGQAADNARSLRLWHDLRAAGVRDVQPLVVLWGPGSGQLTPDGPVDVDGVPVLAGPSAEQWRARLPGGELTADQVDAVWQALDRQARTRDDRDPEPLPPSLAEHALTVLGTALAAGVSVVVAAALIRVIVPLQVWAAACVGLAAAAVPLRHHARARLPVLAWQTGQLGVPTAVAAVILLASR